MAFYDSGGFFDAVLGTVQARLGDVMGGLAPADTLTPTVDMPSPQPTQTPFFDSGYGDGNTAWGAGYGEMGQSWGLDPGYGGQPSLLRPLLDIIPGTDQRAPIFNQNAEIARAQARARQTPAQPAPVSSSPGVTANRPSSPRPAPHPSTAPPAAQPLQGDPLTIDTANPYYGTAWAYATEHGLDPTFFTRQIARESNFTPIIVNPRSGARGIAQIMPEYHPGVNPDDPNDALGYAANWMSHLLKKYGGDIRWALAAYNSGEGTVDPLYSANADDFSGLPGETQKYLADILYGTPWYPAQPQPAAPSQQQHAPAAGGQGGQAQVGAAAPGTPTAWETAYGRGNLTPNQYHQGLAEGLDRTTALAICGPAAAVAFARVNGRNPTLTEALQIAREVGWTPESGMAGTQSQSNLLTRMGIANTLVTGEPDWARVAAEVQAGRPVIIDAGDHYMVAEDYDPRTGAFNFGNSASVLTSSLGEKWWHPSQLANLSMPGVRVFPQATIYFGGP